MGKTSVIVIADAGPLIHLDELNSLDILADYGDIIVPNAVWNEVKHYRPHALVNTEVNLIHKCVENFSSKVRALSPLYTLHLGEQKHYICVLNITIACF